jgi:hypothetical protein
MERNESLVNTLHALFCDSKHSSNMHDLMNGRVSGRCYYYMEENLAECWDMEDHKYWQEQADKLMTDLKVSSPEEALRSIYRTLDVVEKVNELSIEEFSLLKNLLHLCEDS